MANISPQQIAITGLAYTLAAAVGPDTIINNDGANVFLHVKNTDAASRTLTFDDTGSAAPAGASAFNADVAVVVPNGTERMIGPFPISRFTESVVITYSAVTNVTVAAIRL